MGLRIIYSILGSNLLHLATSCKPNIVEVPRPFPHR